MTLEQYANEQADDVKKCTEKYAETVQEADISLMESFELFKKDSIYTYDKQSRMISELK